MRVAGPSIHVDIHPFMPPDSLIHGCMKSLTHCFIDLLILESLNQWFIGALTGGFNDSSIHSFTQTSIHWLISSPMHWFIDWFSLNHPLTASLIHWIIVPLCVIGSWFHWFAESLVYWFIDALNHPWIIFLVLLNPWFIDSLIQWFLDSDWFTDSLVHWFIHSLGVHGSCFVTSSASQPPFAYSLLIFCQVVISLSPIFKTSAPARAEHDLATIVNHDGQLFTIAHGVRRRVAAAGGCFRHRQVIAAARHRGTLEPWLRPGMPPWIPKS